MSDFFGGIYSGVRRPDVVMNDGPLPPLSIGAGYPAGFNGIPDGKINQAVSLLGDLDPYAYGEAARPGSQAAYQPIPHVAQRIVPSLDLPEAQPFNMGGSFFRLSHQVDDGDVAFVIRAMFSPYELVAEKKRYNKQGRLYQTDPIVNLATVNYILHGLQRYGFDKIDHKCWNTLWVALGIDEHFGGSGNYGDGRRRFSEEMLETQREMDMANRERLKDGVEHIHFSMHHFRCSLKMRVMRRKLVDYLVKHVIKPFGVPRGSEKQGGQHQGSNAPVNWPVDFVTAIVVDGKVINLVNCWKHDDVSAGDDLMMYVEDRPYSEYVLSHHPKCMKKQVFPTLDTWLLPASLAECSKEGFVCSSGEDLLKRIWDVLSALEAEADMGAGVPDRPPASGHAHGAKKPHLYKIDDDISTQHGMTSADLKRRWQQQELLAGKERGQRENESRRDAEKQGRDFDPNEAPFRVPKHPYITSDNKMLQDPNNAYVTLLHMLAIIDMPEMILEYIADVHRYSDDYRVSIARAVVEVAQKIEQDPRLRHSFSVAHDVHLLQEGRQQPTYTMNTRAVPVKESIFQLVPGVSSSHSMGVRHAIWRHGYWHIARSQIMHFKYDQHLEIPNGIHAAIRGKLLEAILAPVWVEPLETDVLLGGGYGFESGPTDAFSGSSGHKRKRECIGILPGGETLLTLSDKLKDMRKVCDECTDMMRKATHLSDRLQQQQQPSAPSAVDDDGSGLVQVTQSMAREALLYAEEYLALSTRAGKMMIADPDNLASTVTDTSARSESMKKLLQSTQQDMRKRFALAAEGRIQAAARRGMSASSSSSTSNRVRINMTPGMKNEYSQFMGTPYETHMEWAKNVKNRKEVRCETVLQYLPLVFLEGMQVEPSILQTLMKQSIKYVEYSMETLSSEPSSLLYCIEKDDDSDALKWAAPLFTVQRMLLNFEVNVAMPVAGSLVHSGDADAMDTGMRSIEDLVQHNELLFSKPSIAAWIQERLVRVMQEPFQQVAGNYEAGNKFLGAAHSGHNLMQHVSLCLAALPTGSISTSLKASTAMTPAQSLWACLTMMAFGKLHASSCTNKIVNQTLNKTALCFEVVLQAYEKNTVGIVAAQMDSLVKKCMDLEIKHEGEIHISGKEVADLAAGLLGREPDYHSIKFDRIRFPAINVTEASAFVNDKNDVLQAGIEKSNQNYMAYWDKNKSNVADPTVKETISRKMHKESLELDGEKHSTDGMGAVVPSFSFLSDASPDLLGSGENNNNNNNNNNPLIGSILLSASSEQLSLSSSSSSSSSSKQPKQRSQEGVSANILARDDQDDTTSVATAVSDTAAASSSSSSTTTTGRSGRSSLKKVNAKMLQ